MKDPDSELFNYTTGQRRRVFNIPGLFTIITKALHCKTEEIVGFRKLAEGGFNRTFLVTLDTGFQLVARIPYPLLTSKAYTIASEVATMDFLRSRGLPIPKVYTYSFTSNNEAETEYILMEYIQGTDLSQIWFDLKKDQISSVMRQLAKLESIMMSISFPAGGSIYYARDLKELSGNEGIPLKDEEGGNSLEEERFCLGPDVCPPLWYGRREQLDVFRGPYEDARSVLLTGAKKELAYLDQFGSPRMPYQHLRREYYNYEKQPPSDHANNLRRYLQVAPSLVPADASLSAFCIRHPDPSYNNLKVSTDSSGLQVLSMVDWQHAVVLPLFLHAGMPDVISNEEDEVSRSMVEPKLPFDFDKLSETEQEWEKELLRRRLVHYYYNLFTAVYNRIHPKGLVYPFNTFRRRIFNHSIAIWEGETIKLLYALTDMMLDWEDIAKDGTPCPVLFTEDEILAAEKLYQALAKAEINEKRLRDLVGYGDETWVPIAQYEEAKAFGQEIKQLTLKACKEDAETTAEVYAAVEAKLALGRHRRRGVGGVQVN
ncbi:kinase-like domain-containing protein [Rhodocollybia butyracea]|uniref:Kinase-like domain-containing protein n=1 Tax=Rhodocollybia butyracea TaxID=206335 RepID=A0A9P5PM29_9AGAR|nr:kinase-like domain-containing protein [Rhodocollybia butyracea]